jgi:hypothetical protein
MTTYIFVVSGTTTGSPPGDYQSSGSNWDCIGGGGSGAMGTHGAQQPSGGGGGGFGRVSNVAWSTAQTCQIGTETPCVAQTAKPDSIRGADADARVFDQGQLC